MKYKLRLTPARVREELFRGGFRPFTEHDWDAYCDADPGSLIAEIRVGCYVYEAIFLPASGDVQVTEKHSATWQMDLLNEEVIEL